MSGAAQSNVIPFSFLRDGHNSEVRVCSRDGDPWFVLNDVCAVLDIGNASDVARRLDDDEKGVVIVDTLGGQQTVTIVSEGGLYSLVLTSRKPQAKAFKKWVTSDVLPTIRRSGSYGPPDRMESLMERITTAVEGQTAAVKALAVDVRTVKLDVGEIKSDLMMHGARLNAIDDVIKHNLVKRQNAVEGTIRTLASVTLSRFNGKCPACLAREVVAYDGTLTKSAVKEHYIISNKRDAHHMWIICKECHHEKHAGPHANFAPFFEAFQHRVREHMVGFRQLEFMLPSDGAVRRARRAA